MLSGGASVNRLLTGYAGGPLSLPISAFVHVGVDAHGRHMLRERRLRTHIGSPASQAGVPLISGLMVTQNRWRLAQISINCFRRQTWQRKELVVIDTSRDDRLVSWIRALGDTNIRIFHLPGCTDRLGDLRNLSVEKAKGDLVCQWDDDDLQHPCRLEVAARAMAAMQTKACLLLRELFWFVARRRFAFASQRPHENSILAEKGILPRYPALHRAEDTPVIDKLLDTLPVTLLDIPELYLYVAHGSNTWDDVHMDNIWNLASVRFADRDYKPVFTELAQCFPLMPYLKAVRATAMNAD